MGPSGGRRGRAGLGHRGNPALRPGPALPRPHKREYVFLTHAQLAALANASGRWRRLILVLGYTGLRRGEATALRACDVDLNRRRIDVRRAFTDVEASSSSAH
jgi:integrase